VQKRTLQERPKAHGPLRVDDPYSSVHPSRNKEVVDLTDHVSIPDPTPSSQGINLIK